MPGTRRPLSGGGAVDLKAVAVPAAVQRAMAYERRQAAMQERRMAGDMDDDLSGAAGGGGGGGGGGRRVSVFRAEQRAAAKKLALEERNADQSMTKEQRARRNIEVAKKVHACFREGRYKDANKLLKLAFTRHGGLEVPDLEGNSVLSAAVKTGGDCGCPLQECTCMWRGRKVLYATKHLLMKHAMTDTADNQGFSPLHIAVLNAATSAFYLPVAEALLKGGATGNEELMAPTERVDNAKRQTALHLSSRTGLPATVRLLLKYGADVNAADFKAWTPLHAALDEGAKWAKVRRLKEQRVLRGEQAGSDEDTPGGGETFEHLQGDEYQVAVDAYQAHQRQAKERKAWMSRNANAGEAGKAAARKRARQLKDAEAAAEAAAADEAAKRAAVAAEAKEADAAAELAAAKAAGLVSSEEDEDSDASSDGYGGGDGGRGGGGGGAPKDDEVMTDGEKQKARGAAVAFRGDRTLGKGGGAAAADSDDGYSTDEVAKYDAGRKLGGFADDPTLTVRENPHFVIARMLLDAHADPTLGNHQTGTATSMLHYSCRYRQLRVTNLLLEYYKSPEDGLDLTDALGNTPLCSAVKAGGDVMRDAVEALLQKHANPNIADEGGWSPLHVAVDCVKTSRRYTSVVGLLLKKGASTEMREHRDRRTPLLTAAIEGQERVVAMLLRPKVHPTKNREMWKKAEPDARDRRGWTALHWCLWRAYGGLDEEGADGHPAMSAVTGERAADPVALGEREPPFGLELSEHQAEMRLYMRLARLLLEAGANPSLGNSTIGESVTPLHFAAMNGRVHVARLLLEFGATPGAFALIEFNEWRPLHLAAREGDAAMVKLLLCEHAVDPFSLDPHERTAKDITDVAEEGDGANELALAKRECSAAMGAAMAAAVAFKRAHKAALKALFEDRVYDAIRLATVALDNSKDLDASGCSRERGEALCMRSRAALKSAKQQHLRQLGSVLAVEEEYAEKRQMCGGKMAREEEERREEILNELMSAERCKRWEAALADAELAAQLASQSAMAWEQLSHMLVLFDKHAGAEEARQTARRLGALPGSTTMSHAWEEVRQLSEGVPSAEELANLMLLPCPPGVVVRRKGPKMTHRGKDDAAAAKKSGAKGAGGQGAKGAEAGEEATALHKTAAAEAAEKYGARSNLFAWGLNQFANLGLGHDHDEGSPQPNTSFADRRIVHVASGQEHVVLATVSGSGSGGDNGDGDGSSGDGGGDGGEWELFAWGNHDKGALGLGATAVQLQDTPQLIPTLRFRPVRAVACGRNHTLVLTAEGALGTVYAFGANGSGQLGLGHTEGPVTVPAVVEALTASAEAAEAAGSAVAARALDDRRAAAAGGRRRKRRAARAVSHIACGGAHSVVAFEGGGISTFGRNGNGQLGLGDTLDHAIPKLIPGFEERRATHIAAGVASTLMAAADPDKQIDDTRLYGFGRNNYGQLGVGGTLDHSVPQIVCLAGAFAEREAAEAAAAAAALSSAAMNDDHDGGEGVGAEMTHHLTDILDGGVHGRGGEETNAAAAILAAEEAAAHAYDEPPSAVKGVRTFACGGLHTLVSLDNGQTYAFGHNGYGELGLVRCAPGRPPGRPPAARPRAASCSQPTSRPTPTDPTPPTRPLATPTCPPAFPPLARSPLCRVTTCTSRSRSSCLRWPGSRSRSWRAARTIR
jgi:ankyrin repeat protein/alpha-tubulin suppressor-like RCC1 family protein